MTGEFRREYLLRLPLPLAQLYGRAHNAPAARARHDNTFYLFEALIKLAACPLIASYLRQVEQGEPRSPAIDRLLAQLVLPSLGQWVAILRALAKHIGQRPDAASHPLGHVWRQLDTSRRDCPGILALFRRIKNGPDGQAGGDQSCSLMEVIDALVLYRNTVFGHGAGRCDSFYEQEMGPLLAPAASEFLGEGIFDMLGPRGTRLVYINEIRLLDDRQIEASLSDLVGLEAERMSPLTLSAADNSDLSPNCIALLWPGQKSLLRLDPLLIFRGSAVTDEVLFLNRDRNGQQVEYLSYTTGQIDRDRSLAPAMARLMGRITGREIQEQELAAFAKQSISDTTSVESFFETTSRRRTMGDYEILAEVGRGGMGVVYLARQLSLGRLVALKMLPADLAGDESALSRFRREMRALGRCEHPNIVKVLASGTLPDGQLYYAMEYIPGADLEMVWRELAGPNRLGAASTLGGTTWGRAVLSASQKQRDQAERRAAGEPTVGAVIASADTQAGDSSSTASFAATPPSTFTPEPLPLPPLPPLPEIEDDPRGFFRRVAALVRDAAAAVQAVHDQNIVHRDIKPANLLLTPDGSRIVLMDFGLAKGQGLTRTASRTGGFLGTLRYAAPEQLAAAKITVGPQADVRALGVTLWELLSRQRLFGDADDENQMASWVLTRDLPPLRKVDNSIDPDLEAIVARATEREVDRRIQTARELGDYLQMYLDGKPLPIRRPGTTEVLGRWVREHKALVGTATAAAASIVLVGVIAFLFVLGAWKREQSANAQLTNTNQQLEDSKTTLVKANTSLETALKEVAAANTQKDEALTSEKKARLDAQRNEQQAVTSRKIAEEREGEARQSLYASRMLMTHQSLAADELARAMEQLDIRKWAADSSQFTKLRGWEWSYLDGLVRARTTNLAAPGSAVWTVDWSGNGKWIASGDNAGKVLVYNADRNQVADIWNNRRSWTLGLGLKYEDKKLRVVKVFVTGFEARSLPPEGSTIVAWSDTSGRMVELDSLDPAGIQKMYRESIGKPWIIKVLLPNQEQRTFTVQWKSNPPLQHSNRVTAVAFSHNSRWLATASWDDSVLVWDMEDLRFPTQFSGFGDGAYGLAFSPNDELLAVGGSDDNIHVLHLERRTRNKLPGHTGIVNTLSFSSDGKQLASGGRDGTLRLWSLENWTLEKTLTNRPDPFGLVTYLPDGKTLLGMTVTGKITTWEMPSRKVIYNDEPIANGASCLAFNRKGDVAVCGVFDGNLSRLACTAGVFSEKEKFHMHSAWVRSVALSPDGRYSVSAASDDTLRVSDLKLSARSEDQLCRRFDSGTRSGIQMTFTPDQRQLMIGSGIRLSYFDAATGRPLAGPGGLIKEFAGYMRNVALSRDTTQAAFGLRDGSLRVVSTVNGRLIRHLPTDPRHRHRAGIGMLAFSPNGRLLASADRERMVSVWDLQTGQLLYKLECNGGRTRSALFFSPDNRLLVTGFGSSGMQIWDVETSELLTELTEDRPYRATFDPSAERLYVGGFHSVITVWDMKTYQPIQRLQGHRGPITDVEFNADGTRLASAGGDGMIILWEPQTGQQVLQLGRMEGLIAGLAFRPDGRGLAALDTLSPYFYLWDAPELSPDPRHREDWFA
ncbi:MAG: protein kinase, partial [Planctomycetes bacterium]|nr:protein kinase [Planctomycetota bacterium]